MLHIRPYTGSDFPAVLHLHRIALEATGTYVGNGSWENDLLNIQATYFESGGTFLVGIINGSVVAMGALRKVSETTAEIKRMRVLPNYQRQGFGQLLLSALETNAKNLNITKLCLDTTVFQVAAQWLYVKNGYIEVRRTKTGYPFETIFYEKLLR